MLSTIDLGPMLKTEKLLTDDPVVVRVNEFTEAAAAKFASDLSRAIGLGMPFVPVVIDSYGGEVYSLLAMIGAMDNCPVPVATVLKGKAMSCGAMLFAMGTPGYRFMSPRGHIMMHHVWTAAFGIVPQIKEDVKQMERLDRQLFEMVDANCGHQPGFFHARLKDKEGADWYIKPDEAVSLGLADHLYVPTLVTKIRATMEFSPPSKVVR